MSCFRSDLDGLDPVLGRRRVPSSMNCVFKNEEILSPGHLWLEDGDEGDASKNLGTKRFSARLAD